MERHWKIPLEGSWIFFRLFYKVSRGKTGSSVKYYMQFCHLHVCTSEVLFEAGEAFVGLEYCVNDQKGDPNGRKRS